MEPDRVTVYGITGSAALRRLISATASPGRAFRRTPVLPVFTPVRAAAPNR
jgi:hypothetical protein